MMIKPEDSRRRWFGALFIIIAAGMLVWGQTFLKSYLFEHKLTFVFFWMTCFGLTGLAMLTALLDLYIMRRRSRSVQHELFRESVAEIDPELEKAIEEHKAEVRKSAT